MGNFLSGALSRLISARGVFAAGNFLNTDDRNLSRKALSFAGEGIDAR
ncbi:hypothetical protein WBP07_11570 [Novosphingobium sp. BL-8A]